MGLLSNTWMGCLLAMLPGPPGMRFYNAYFQLLPVDKLNIYCPDVEVSRDVTFRFYFRFSPNESQELRIGDDDGLEASGLDLKLPTVVYFPPFFEGENGKSALAVKDAYMERGGYNFILVDSKRLNAGPWYPAAVSNTHVVGRYTAAFVDYLLSRGLSFEGLHFIGMSIGAHAAGVAGNFLRAGKPPRITGLDPASIMFAERPASMRLDKTDAKFVDVIHTDAIFGMSAPMGHVDFYVNSGRYPQPGCQVHDVIRRTGRFLYTIFCGHMRANQLYAKTVLRPNRFPGVRCPSWTLLTQGKCAFGHVEVMGIDTSLTARGVYFVPVEKSPAVADFSNEIT